MNYQEWEASVPRDITDGVLLTVEAYRLALFVAEIGCHPSQTHSLLKEIPFP